MHWAIKQSGKEKRGEKGNNWGKMEQKGQNWGIKGKIHSSINKKLINYAIWLSYGTVSVPQPRICWQNSQCQGAKYNQQSKYFET